MARYGWSNEFEFLFHCMIPSVGINGLWRYPYALYTGGGGSFWCAYLIVAATIGVPLLYLKLARGQFASKANVHLFSQFGYGYTGVAASETYTAFCAVIYYSVILAYILIYIGNSLTHWTLPWSTCDAEDVQCVPAKSIVYTNPYKNYSVSTEIFFKKMVLPDSIFPRWELCACLLVSACLINFLANSHVRVGKLVHVAILFPMICKLVLCGLAWSLRGGSEGINYFLSHDLSNLKQVDVWANAVAQCFFSLSFGFGTVSACAARSSFHFNAKRVAVMVVALDCLFCALVGAAVFGILGHLSYALKVNISDLFEGRDINLAFVLYPIAINQFHYFIPILSLILFTTFYTLCLLCVIKLNNVLVMFVSYWYPDLLHWRVVLMCTVGCFLLQLLFITSVGTHLIELIDKDCMIVITLFTNICELLALTYGYGIESVCLDLQYMQKTKVGVYWRMMWAIAIPIILILVFYYLSFAKHSLVCDHSAPYHGVRYFIVFIGIMQIPSWTAYYCYKSKHMTSVQVL
ncbi:sodium-dependent nutrient amino acid transporter 1-like isoform X2 [Photinus pyralis]|uniref:sodium-dependent nutrient amino acid transporter 1-like isoform X2 n=1 Tax=Photinus pyralis TaxID=7054 RepID=UPI00126758A8|nr:sodium-dependent nutrient amino acid transporter 1-like isoform X2 [Photinus pyralis]